MKWFLAATVALALSATSYASVKSDPNRYILIYPHSTIETDFGGRCVRVENVGDASVYLSLGASRDFEDALTVAVAAKKLKVTACGAR